MKDEPVKIILINDGPLIARGDFTIIGADAKTIVFSPDQLQNGVAICRCGKSKDMPLCDGAHAKNNLS